MRRCPWLMLISLYAVLPGCRGPVDTALAPPLETTFRGQNDPADEVAENTDEQPAVPVAEQSAAIPVMPIGPVQQPLPRMLVTPWKPPGVACPWPEDEWIHDGGDQKVHVNITREPAIRGLDLEDTVVTAETANGCKCKIIQPSNRVHLYAPRFMAVRKVTTVVQNQLNQKAGGTEQPVAIVSQEESLLAGTATQPLQPLADFNIDQPNIERLQQPAGRIIERLMVADLQDAILPYENLSIIKFGIYEAEEKPMLAERIDAAITWTADRAVQVLLEGRRAQKVVGDQRAQATFRFDEPCNPQLRVVKVASTQVARPGDFVEFTIRFDNTGDQTLENVALLDNLTTRLEYVADSAQSSVEAEFSTVPNEGDSLVLRWDFKEPIKPGEGGLVRFKCRVR